MKNDKLNITTPNGDSLENSVYSPTRSWVSNRLKRAFISSNGRCNVLSVNEKASGFCRARAAWIAMIFLIVRICEMIGYRRFPFHDFLELKELTKDESFL